MNQESCGSSLRDQDGSPFARMARATSIPAAFPPTSPVPTMRRRMASRSSSVRWRPAISAKRSSRVNIMRISDSKAARSSSGRRRPARTASRMARAASTRRSHTSACSTASRRRSATSTSASESSALSVRGRSASPSRTWGRYMVGEWRPSTLSGWRYTVAPAAEDVHQDLGGAAHRVHGLGGVVAGEQREVGHRVELVQVRAGDHEEVAQHEVAVPVGGEIAEAVEDVERARSGRLDGAVDGVGEALEPERRRDAVDLGARRLVEQGLVAGEAEVDDAAPLGAGPGHEGQDERRVVVEVLDLPDHVVARPESLQDVVEGGDAGPGRIDGDHRGVWDRTRRSPSPIAVLPANRAQ